MQSVAWSNSSITVVESTGLVDGGMRRNVVLLDCRTQEATNAQQEGKNGSHTHLYHCVCISIILLVVSSYQSLKLNL